MVYSAELDDSSSRAEQAIGAFLILGLAIALSAPPGIQAPRADQACAELATSKEVPEGEWSMLPIPHWTCTVEGEVVEHLGWWL
jgi:hypothetical protein